MKIWIFQTGEPLPSDGADARPMRAMNVASALVNRGHDVVLWSSSFYHQEKRHRSHHYEKIQLSESLEVRLIPSCGYDRNIGPARLLDHAQLALNLKKALAEEKTIPDVAFVGYPPIEFAYVATKWLKERKIPSLLDAKDQWPQIFVDPFPAKLQPLARLLLFPYFYLGRESMRQATALSSMADGFLAWMKSYSGRSDHPNDCIVPLSSPRVSISDDELNQARDFWAAKGVLDDGNARFFFVGSLSRSFDFSLLHAAAKRAATEGKKWQFVICGDGEEKSHLDAMFGALEHVVLPGWTNRSQMEALALISTAGLAPYKNTVDFMNSIPNKVIDYLSFGKPVISPLKGEVEKLILTQKVGFLYEDGDLDSLYHLLEIADQRGSEFPSAEHVLEIYEEHFSSEKNYNRLVSNLETLQRTSELSRNR